MTCNFSLPYRVNSPRFVKVEEVVPGWWAHRLRITEPAQLDEEIQRWVRESHRLWECRSASTILDRKRAADFRESDNR